MKGHRRIEITAFQRKVTIVSGEFEAYTGDTSEGESRASENSLETVPPESAEGRRILADAVRLLEDRLIDRSDRLSQDDGRDILPADRDGEGKP